MTVKFVFVAGHKNFKIYRPDYNTKSTFFHLYDMGSPMKLEYRGRQSTPCC